MKLFESRHSRKNTCHKVTVHKYSCAYGLLATAMLLPALSSCSDDKDLPLPALEEKTFTGADALHLSYDGYDMPGKSVTVTPTADGKATLTLFSEFDLSQLDIKGFEGKIPAPGVIPGEVTTQIPVELTAGNGFRSFAGKSATGPASYSFSGRIYADSLVMEIADVKLNELAEALNTSAWKLAPLEKADEGWGYKSMPFQVEWDVDPIEGIDIPLTELLTLAVTVPCIPVYHDTAYSSVAQLIGQLVQSVKFLPNGNIWVNYMSSVGGATHLASLNPTTLQYSIAAPQYLKLYVNPLSVAGLAMTSGVLNDVKLPQDSNVEALMPLIKQLTAELSPMMAAGLPMAYRVQDDTLAVFFDQTTAAPLVQAIFKVILSDSTVQQLLMAEISKYPELAQKLPQLMQVLQQIPAYLEKTNRFELGLKFVRL